MHKVIIVSSANSKYFQLLSGLVQSIRDKQEFDIDIGIMDGGLKIFESDWLRGYGCTVKKVPFTLKATLESGEIMPEHFVAFMERPYINQHFPGYDIYIWMDADTWVQDWKGIELYIRVAKKGYVGIVPEVNRQIVFNELHRSITAGFSLANYDKFFGEEVAKELSKYPMFNNGVFSIDGYSKAWDLYSSAMFAALHKNKYPDFGIDQIALNYILYYGGLRPYPLPFSCNWLVSHAIPCWHKGELVEPLLPHSRINIIHLLDQSKWERQAIKKIDDEGEVLTADARSLDYFEFRQYSKKQWAPTNMENNNGI